MINSTFLDALAPNLDLNPPDEVWDSVWIDGGKCKGCFSTRRERQTTSNIRGNSSFEWILRCFLETPRCQCNCRVVCGSTVSFDGKQLWEVIDSETTAHPNCDKWEIIKKDCDVC